MKTSDMREASLSLQARCLGRVWERECLEKAMTSMGWEIAAGKACWSAYSWSALLVQVVKGRMGAFVLSILNLHLQFAFSTINCFMIILVNWAPNTGGVTCLHDLVI